MPTGTEAKILDDCRKIRELIQIALDAGKTVNHKEIRSSLGIPDSTYWKRIDRIYEADREAFAEISKTSVEVRTLRMREALEFVSTTNYDIASDKEESAKDRRECAQAYFTAELWLYQLDTHGPNLPKLQDYVRDNVVEPKKLQSG